MTGPHRIVNMKDDAYIPPPGEMAADLARLAEDAEADYYGQGGAVKAFEAQVAAFLGKERAVMFPTGTLGNLLAIQRLTGGPPARIITHRQSHFFNDSGDNLAQIGGFAMVPLEGDGAGYSADQLKAEIDRAASARVAARIGAVTVESPSRRLDGRRFGPELGGVIALARSEGLPLFLDGARMLIESGWTGVDAAELAAPFDLVYLSLYKYLGAPFGCVIVGRANLLEEIHHDRRRHGGSLWQMWPAAVLAADALPRQKALWAEARAAGAATFDALRALGRGVTTYSDGTNVFRVPCPPQSDAVANAAEEERLALPPLPSRAGTVALKVNETWIGQDPVDLASRLDNVLKSVTD